MDTSSINKSQSAPDLPRTDSIAAAAAPTVFRRGWIYRDFLVPWAVSRLTLVLVAWLAMYLLNHVPLPGAWEIGPSGNVTPFSGPVSPSEHPFVNMWSRWDAGWYHNIAQRGYKFTAGQRSNVAFFPVYPMLIRAAHAVVHSRKDIWWLVCGIVVSNAALLGALVYLFRLTRLDFDEATARRAVLYLLIFPTTLFLSAVYSESVFLFFMIGSFYHARKREWWWAGLLGGIATLSRPPGIMIFAGLLAEYMIQCEYNWRKLRLNALALSLPPLGLAGYFAYLRYADGTAAAVVDAQGTWGLGLQNPWRTIAPFFERGMATQGSMVDLGFTLAFVVLVIVIAFRLRLSYAAYALAYLVFVTMWGSLDSMPRYVIGIFPAIILFAAFGRNQTFHRAWVPISAGLAALFMAVFAVWGWVA